MDKPRIGYARKKRIRQITIGVGALIGITVLAWALTKLEPSAPSVDSAVVFADTVKRGEMLRQVRGIGTLVPKSIVLIAAGDAGRVERRQIQPGQPVQPGTILVELSSPQMQLEYLDAEAQLRGAQAELANLHAQHEDARLTQESVTADIEGQFLQAKAQYEAELQLSKAGLIDQVTLAKSPVSVEQMEKRFHLERAREEARKPSVEAQLAAQNARIEQLNALVTFRREKLDMLRVRSGMRGVLQAMEVEVGQLVAPGDVLARVSDPTRLKAELRIPETLVNDVVVGLAAQVDTRNGVIAGEVVRIDPAAVEGTVLVDVELKDELPRGARPDLSVDGTIELERLDDVLYLGRPIHAREESVIGLFRVEEDQVHAVRVQVQVGRISVSTIEIRAGLVEGDKVILSDTSAWDAYDRIRLD